MTCLPDIYAHAGEQVTCEHCGKVHMTFVRAVIRNATRDLTALQRPDGSSPQPSEPYRPCECGGLYARGDGKLHFAGGWR